MNSTRLFKKTVIAATIALASQQAVAAGFQLNAQSATGLGRAFAGDAVIADNASVMSRNAAAMALFDSSQFSTGVNVISTDIKVTDINDGAIADVNNGSTTPVPNVYYIHRLNDQWAFGAGVYSNFGTNNNFDDDFGGTGMLPTAKRFGGTTEVKSINYALTASYRVNEQWSVGLGLDIVQGSGKLKRETGSTFQPTIPATALNVEADGFGLGWNAGVVYEMDELNRFGFSYHYSPEIKASGDMSYLGQDISSHKLLMPLPSMAEFSGYHEIKDTKFAVHYSVQWIGWSAFDELKTDQQAAGKNLNSYDWKDTWHYSVGGTYFLTEAWTLRAGYMYDMAAQDEKKSISVPDSDRQWFSGGASYAFNQHHTIDFGFTYLVGKNVDVVEKDSFGSLTATTRADAILAGVQYSYSF